MRHFFSCCAGLLLACASFSLSSAQLIRATASINGQVWNEHHLPAHVRVVLLGKFVEDGFARYFPTCATQTDEEGRYVCDTLRPGTYLLLAETAYMGEPGGHGDVVPAVTEHRVPAAPDAIYRETFYPGVTEFNDAEWIQMKEDQVKTLNFTLRATQSGVLSIGLPSDAASPTLTLLVDDLLHHGVAVTPKLDAVTQKYVVEKMPPGRYRVAATWFAGNTTHQADGMVTVTHGGHVNVALTEFWPSALTGHLEKSDDDKAPLPKFVVLDGTVAGAPWSMHLKVATKDGSFKMQVLWPGSYNLHLSESSDYAIRNSTDAHFVLPGNSFTINGNGAPVDIAATLMLASGEIRGTVQKGTQSATTCEVMLQRPDGSLLRTQVAQDGSFSFPKIGPGDYTLFAVVDPTRTEYRSPAFLKQHEFEVRTLHLFGNTEKIDAGELAEIKPSL